MSSPEFEAIPGMRVCAIRSVEDGKVYLYGFGIYEGDFRPPVDIRFDNDDMGGSGRTNPRILLDNGKVVWGFECWWSPENNIRELLKEADEIIHVDIDEDRRKASELNFN